MHLLLLRSRIAAVIFIRIINFNCGRPFCNSGRLLRVTQSLLLGFEVALGHDDGHLLLGYLRHLRQSFPGQGQFLPVLPQSLCSTFEPFVKGPALRLLLKSHRFSRIGPFLRLDFRFDSGDGVRTNGFDQSDDVLVIRLLSSNVTELCLVKIGQF